MRGKILRTELYSLDGTARQSLPYTVTEHVYSARQQVAGNGPSPAVFFPFLLSERTTQWERGNDPLTLFTFCDNRDSKGQPLDYDAYGQSLSQISVAVPRGRDFQAPGNGPTYLATQAVSTYAVPTTPQPYTYDRVSSVAGFELVNDGTLPVVKFVQQVQSGSGARNLISHSINRLAPVAPGALCVPDRRSAAI
jgi:hypothetical protein